MWHKGQIGVRGFILLLLIAPMARGGEAQPQTAVPESPSFEDWFSHGRWEAALTGGVLFSPFLATHGRPTIDYTYSGVQLGYMVCDTLGSSWWRGNFEVAADTFGSAIFEGSGSYIAGETFWLRWNFVPPKLHGLTPYVQGGLGFVFTDIDRSIVGQRFNFNLDIGIGARYFISQRCSVNLEYRYQHISNANMGEHNLGINSHGPILGFSYFF
jgi:hypothetical protein